MVHLYLIKLIFLNVLECNKHSILQIRKISLSNELTKSFEFSIMIDLNINPLPLILRTFAVIELRIIFITYVK